MTYQKLSKKKSLYGVAELLWKKVFSDALSVVCL